MSCQSLAASDVRCAERTADWGDDARQAYACHHAHPAPYHSDRWSLSQLSHLPSCVRFCCPGPTWGLGETPELSLAMGMVSGWARGVSVT
jgi:hypothetical protein